MDEKVFYTPEQILEILGNELEDNGFTGCEFCLYSTKDYNLQKKSNGRKDGRNAWANKMAKEFFGKERSDIVKQQPRVLSTGEYAFVYIKFFVDETGKIYGGVNGLSSIHKGYPGDVWFYPVPDKNKPAVTSLMEKHGFSWYTEQILLIRSAHPKRRDEARELETFLHDCFKLEN